MIQNRKLRRKYLAFLLSVVMTVSLMPMYAFAEPMKVYSGDPADIGDMEAPVYVYTKDRDDVPGDVTANIGKITSDDEQYNSGLKIFADDESTATVSVKDITAETGNGILVSNGNFAEATTGGTVFLTVNGNVSGAKNGIVANTNKDGTSVLVLTGNAGGGENGIKVYTWNGESTAELNGDAHGGKNGVYVGNEDGTTDYTMTGNAGGGENGIKVYTWNGESTAELNGDAYGDTNGVYVGTSGGITDYTMTGNAGGGENGIKVYTWNGESKATVNGDAYGGKNGVYVGSEGGTTDFTMAGNASGEKYGIKNNTWNGRSTSSITGDVNGGEDGIYVYTEDGESSMTVTGDVTGFEGGVYVESKDGKTGLMTTGKIDGEMAGMIIDAEGGEVAIASTGKVKGGLAGVVAEAGNGAAVKIKVAGDVLSDGVGAYLGTYDDEGSIGTVDLLVDGTITGNDIGLATEEGYSSNITVTAWKITPNNDGWIAGYVDEEGELTGRNEGFEKNINYIVRVEQPAEGAYLSASNDTAHEGENVALRIDLKDGYKVTGAFSDEGRSIPLLQDGAGNYYVVVPKGGGVLLSVAVEKKYLPPQPVNDDYSSGTEETVGSVAESAEQMILYAAPGATVSVSVTSGISVSRTIVDALTARPDITLIVDYLYNGVMYRAIIPAFTYLTPYINEMGCIDFETLTVHFGGKPIF